MAGPLQLPAGERVPPRCARTNAISMLESFTFIFQLMRCATSCAHRPYKGCLQICLRGTPLPHAYATGFAGLAPAMRNLFTLAGHCTSIPYKNCLQICLEFPCLRKMVLVRYWLRNGVMVQRLVADADPWHQTKTIAADCRPRPFLRMVLNRCADWELAIAA